MYIMLFDGRLAQRESTAFTRQGSVVRSHYRPPDLSIKFEIFTLRDYRNLNFLDSRLRGNDKYVGFWQSPYVKLLYSAACRGDFN